MIMNKIFAFNNQFTFLRVTLPCMKKAQRFVPWSNLKCTVARVTRNWGQS